MKVALLGGGTIARLVLEQAAGSGPLEHEARYRAAAEQCDVHRGPVHRAGPRGRIMSEGRRA